MARDKVPVTTDRLERLLHQETCRGKTASLKHQATAKFRELVLNTHKTLHDQGQPRMRQVAGSREPAKGSKLEEVPRSRAKDQLIQPAPLLPKHMHSSQAPVALTAYYNKLHDSWGVLSTVQARLDDLDAQARKAQLATRKAEQRQALDHQLEEAETRREAVCVLLSSCIVLPVSTPATRRWLYSSCLQARVDKQREATAIAAAAAAHEREQACLEVLRREKQLAAKADRETQVAADRQARLQKRERQLKDELAEVAAVQEAEKQEQERKLVQLEASRVAMERDLLENTERIRVREAEEKLQAQKDHELMLDYQRLLTAQEQAREAALKATYARRTARAALIGEQVEAEGRKRADWETRRITLAQQQAEAKAAADAASALAKKMRVKEDMEKARQLHQAIKAERQTHVDNDAVEYLQSLATQTQAAVQAERKKAQAVRDRQIQIGRDQEHQMWEAQQKRVLEDVGMTHTETLLNHTLLCKAAALGCTAT